MGTAVERPRTRCRPDSANATCAASAALPRRDCPPAAALPTSDLQQRTIIDGQQRLTTLQLLLDALHSEIAATDAKMSAARLEPLTANAPAFCRHSEDRFKVWPTNRDRAAFHEVMGASPPVGYGRLEHGASRRARAHQYFALQCRAWLASGGPDGVVPRAEAIERAARELLQLLVIDPAATENAQEIFETLNARGAILTAADLIKNFVFQRLLEQNADVEGAYGRYWSEFETAFWEEELSIGRVKIPRSSLFLNHWLIARTGEEVLAREVFSSFKVFADFHAGVSMLDLLKDLHRAAGIYKEIAVKADTLDGPLDRVGLFAYRAKTLENEVIKPVLLALLDHEAGRVPQHQLEAALEAIESWLVRRMLIRTTAKSYNKIVVELVGLIRSTPVGGVGDAVRQYFSSQSAEVAYWPDDDEVRGELQSLGIYRKLSRARLRMLLEAIEDHWRGWISGEISPAGMRIRRGTYVIEHLMPQAWAKNWPLPPGLTEEERNARIHRLGNLTLLTNKLNATISNGAWLGDCGKSTHLQERDVVLMNSRLLKQYGTRQWDEAGIDQRTQQAIDALLAIWPVPAGHKVPVRREPPPGPVAVEVADLLEASYLQPGATLHSGVGKHGGHTAIVLPDGRIEVAGRAFESPSSAASSILGRPANGWDFWKTDPAGRTRLKLLRARYLQDLRPDERGPDAV